MKKNKSIILCAIFTSLLFSSCKYGLEEVFYRKNPVEERTTKLSTLDTKLDFSGKDSYSFVVISDVHFGAKDTPRSDLFLDFVKENNPAFCISLGDTCEHGLEEEYIAFNKNIIDALKELNIPTFCVTGNHDLYNSGWDCFIKYNYPYTSFYTFALDDISYYFIDSASGNLSKPQFTILKEAIEKDPNRKCIFSHLPLYAEDTTYFVMQDTEERNELISLFEQNNVQYFFGGHIHKSLKTEYNNFVEINVPAFLEQTGWTIVNVDQKEKKITYQSLLQ